MANDRDELGKVVRGIASAARQRGHATWFHTSGKLKPAMEVYVVAEWAKVLNERHGWNIRDVRKNPDPYPDCLADFGPVGAGRPVTIGIEVTELVDSNAIAAHQEERREAKAGKTDQISNADRLHRLERMDPEWTLDKFRTHLEKSVREKDRRARDGSLEKQFLLVITDEQDLNEDTLRQYMDKVSLPRPKNFDAVYLMASPGSNGQYPVFEIPQFGA